MGGVQLTNIWENKGSLRIRVYLRWQSVSLALRHKTLGLMANTPSTRHCGAPGRLEAEGSEVQGHYQLHQEFEANMGYRDMKEKLTNKQNLLLSWKMKNLVRGTNSVIENCLTYLNRNKCGNWKDGSVAKNICCLLFQRGSRLSYQHPRHAAHNHL